MLEEAGEGSIYSRASRGDRALPVNTWTRARRRTASVGEGEGDAAHAGTVGERGRAQECGGGDEHSAQRTIGLAGPRPCSLRRAPALVSARREL